MSSINTLPVKPLTTSPAEKRGSSPSSKRPQEILFGDPFEVDLERPLAHQPEIPVENFKASDFITIAKNDGSGFPSKGEYAFAQTGNIEMIEKPTEESPVTNISLDFLKKAPVVIEGLTTAAETTGKVIQSGASETLGVFKYMLGGSTEFINPASTTTDPKAEQKKAEEKANIAAINARIGEQQTNQQRVRAEQAMKETMRVIEKPTITFQDLDMIKISNPSIDAKKVVGAYYLTEIRKAQQYLKDKAKKPQVISSPGSKETGPNFSKKQTTEQQGSGQSVYDRPG